MDKQVLRQSLQEITSLIEGMQDGRNWARHPIYDLIVSEDGNTVYRLCKPKGRPRKDGTNFPQWKEETIRQTGKYPHVLTGHKKPRSIHMHRLVLEAFRGIPKEKGIVGRHLNDVRTDNRLENLEWGTYSDNMNDAYRNGGRRIPSSLTEEQVREIRDSEGTVREIAERYGVTGMTVSNIRRRVTWGHLE